MGILIVLFFGTLSIIYFSSYRQVYHKNMDMLSIYAKLYWENGNPQEKGLLAPWEGKDLSEDNTSLIAGFYSVAVSDSGEVISIDNRLTLRATNEELINLYDEVRKTGKQQGNLKDWIYYVSENDDVTLVVFMDNMLMSSSITTLFKNTLLYGGILLILMIYPSVFLAHRIVYPLEESDRKQKQFISDASHELKTPIAVVSTNAEMLEREIGENRWLSNIQYENRQMGELVRQLLNLARAENNTPIVQELDFSQVVMGSVLPFEGVAFDKEIRLESAITENTRVRGSGEQLGILVSILLDNALEYSKHKGKVVVSLKKEHHIIVLSVSNEGEAIPKQIQERLFERFYRANDEREHESGHYGLGLAIAKAIVTGHDGKIGIECQNGWVTFKVKLPECK